MADIFHLTITTPHGKAYEGDVIELQLDTPGGPISVLGRHMPLVVPVVTSVLSIHATDDVKAASWDHFAVSDGLLSVDKHGVRVAVGSAEYGNEVDVLKAQQDLEEAEAELEQRREEEEIAVTEAFVERSAARIAAASLHGKIGTSSKAVSRVEAKIRGRR